MEKKQKLKKHSITCEESANICAENILNEHFLSKEFLVEKIKNHYRFIVRLKNIPRNLDENDIEVIKKFKRIDIEREYWKQLIKEYLSIEKFKQCCEEIETIINSININ